MPLPSAAPSTPKAHTPCSGSLGLPGLLCYRQPQSGQGGEGGSGPSAPALREVEGVRAGPGSPLLGLSGLVSAQQGVLSLVLPLWECLSSLTCHTAHSCSWELRESQESRGRDQ